MMDDYKRELMPTGIIGLDQLLEGGVVRGNSLLIEGPPGSGKTTLGIRIIYEGVMKYDEPGLIVSFEEIPRQIYQEAKGFGVDLARLENEGKLRVVWTTPQRIVEGFTGKNDLIQGVIEDLGVKRILVDSLTHFRRVAISEQDMRELLSQLLNFLKLKNINAVLVKELDRVDDNIIAFEEYLVDSSMRLHNSLSASGGENQRFIEIRKTRGQGHISGRHPLILGYTLNGLHIYPRLRVSDIADLNIKKQATKEGRASTGIDALDEMLFGGFHRGSFNLLNGYPGSGKSVFAGQFLEAGLRNDESVLMVTGKSNVEKIIQQMESVGLNWSEAFKKSKLHILPFQADDPCVESIIADLIFYFQRYDIDRLVIDSLDDIWNLVRDDNRFRNYVRLLNALFDASGTTSMILKETKSMGGMDGDDFVSILSACVVQLSMSESNGALHRFISVKKHAGSDHAKDLREIKIDKHGCHILSKASGLSGILTGNARGSLSNISQTVLDDLNSLIDICSNMLASENTPPGMLEDIQKSYGFLSKLDVLLREHFGLTKFREIAEEEQQESIGKTLQHK